LKSNRNSDKKLIFCKKKEEVVTFAYLLLEIMIKGTLIIDRIFIEKLKSGDPETFSNIFLAYYKDLVSTNSN